MSKFTPGPWQWDVTQSGEVRLVTPDRGRLYVMGFARQGMRGAQPRFSLWGEGPRERRGGIMHDFSEAGGALHPDARLIAAAPELLEALIAMEAEKSDYMIRNKLGNPAAEHTNKMARAAIAKATGEQA